METCWIGFEITGIQVCPRNSLEDLFQKCLSGRLDGKRSDPETPQNGWILITMIPAFMKQPNNQRPSMKIHLKFRKGCFFFSCKVFQSQLVTWGEFIQDSQIFLPSNLTCIFLVKIVGAIPGSSICVSNLCPNSPRKTLPLKAGTFYIGRIISFRFLHSLTPLTPSLPPSLFRQLVGPLGRPRYPP